MIVVVMTGQRSDASGRYKVAREEWKGELKFVGEADLYVGV